MSDILWFFFTCIFNRVSAFPFPQAPGKLAGKSALDLMDKACNEPNTDENVPRQMKAMLQLALEGSETWIAWTWRPVMWRQPDSIWVAQEIP